MMIARLWASLTIEQQDAVLLIALPEQLDALAVSRLEERALLLSRVSLRKMSKLISASGRYETFRECALRLKISISKLRRRLNNKHAPPHDVQRGPTGRRIAIRSNPLADAFFRGPRHPVNKLASEIVKLSMSKH